MGWLSDPGDPAADEPRTQTAPADDYGPGDPTDADHEQNLEDMLMRMFHEIHYLGGLAEAVHGLDATGTPTDLLRLRNEHIGFKRLSAALAAKGAHDPDALAAYIGRKKLGHEEFAARAAAGRAARKAAGH